MATDAPTRSRRVVVVGGGVTGLAAAHALVTGDPDVEVLLLESSPVVGGKLRLGEVAGVTVDLGAESILNRRPEGVALARAAGLGTDVVHPETAAARVWSRGALRPLPRSVMGIPADLDGLAESEVLSAEGLARAAEDRDLPATTLPDEDVSVGWLIEQRLGREVLDRLVEPLLGGVYAGLARELSLRATLPQALDLLRRDPSLTRAAAASLAVAPATRAEEPADSTSAASPVAVPVFAGLAGGVGRLPQAVADSAAAAGGHRLEVRTGATVRSLRRTSHGWRLVVGPTTAAEEIEADAVVLALPAAPAARLLADDVPAAAPELAGVDYASVALVTLAFRAGDLPAPVGSGFLVPAVEGLSIKAATYSSAKWGWLERAADGLVLMRTSLGRHREERDLQRDDPELVDLALADLGSVSGLSARPVDAAVTRWGGGLPQYAVGHLDRVRRVREAVARQPGLTVAGAAYDGVGIPACVASGERAAREVLAFLAARPEPSGG
ncbi:protoporphyrinogen oxidase [Nocardioides sp. HDW12B]|uniref:protoporphyrinogen oxidase n=1 Tax=Nocardioides sp. HDW12B TaxID=2714939 RepID=UPI00140AF80D|nr:protoporphyrinogen oxidase [Nocardioides sp. HDW12B]QIK66197.1 protoporphyrinogen oxidase [Nocardioides sp. HDW12B]